MALTYTQKRANALAVGDVITSFTDQVSGGRVYKVNGTVGPDERPTVTSVVQVKSPNETVRGDGTAPTDNSNGHATGPVLVGLSGGSLAASSPQTAVLAPYDVVVVSSGTAAAADV